MPLRPKTDGPWKYEWSLSKGVTLWFNLGGENALSNGDCGSLET